MSTLLVTIITATFNSEKTINDTLISVKNQTYSNIEHIIIDGLSTDRTIEIVNKLSPNVTIYSETDDGIYDAMNKGISLAKGDIIAILNSDDFYSSATVINEIVNMFVSSNCDAVYGDLDYVDSDDTSVIKRRWISGKYKQNSFLYGWMPPHPTFFVKKSVYQRFGFFNLKLRSSSDYELMLRFIYKNKITISYLPITIVKMRMGGQSNKNIQNRVKANNEDKLAWEINYIKPLWFTLYLKPLRKISQFFI